MKLREALITQSPSLELQRAAQVEIARLDSEVARLTVECANAREELIRMMALLKEHQDASLL